MQSENIQCGHPAVVLGRLTLDMLVSTLFRQVWSREGDQRSAGSSTHGDSLLSLQRVVLSFDFPFYGHPLRQITIATGGKEKPVRLGEDLEVSC